MSGGISKKKLTAPIIRRKYTLLVSWILLTIILGVLSVTMFNELYDIQSPIVRKPQEIVSPLAKPKKTTLVPHIEVAHAETPAPTKKAPITKTALQTQVLAYFPKAEHEAVIELVQRESSWNPNAINSSSGATGLYQILPFSKAGCDSIENIACQTLWFQAYLADRYGDIFGAIEFWDKQKALNGSGWY